MSLFYAAIKSNLVSFFRFSLLFNFQVITYVISLICHFKYLYLFFYPFLFIIIIIIIIIVIEFFTSALAGGLLLDSK